MSNDSPTIIQEQPTVRWPVLGLIGLLIAFAAWSGQLLTPQIAEALQPPPPPKKNIAEKVADFGARVVEKVKGEEKAMPAPMPEVQQPLVNWNQRIRLIVAGASVLGVLLGVLSWVRGENHRVSIAAMAVGSLALAWSYVLLGIVCGVIVAVVIIVLEYFYFG